MAKREYNLRRTISQFSELPFEDLEKIWASLNTAEQQRLRPLMNESQVPLPLASGDPDALPRSASFPPIDAKAEEDRMRRAAKLASVVDSVSIELAARICFGLRINQEHALLEALTREGLNSSLIPEDSYDLTQRAGQALVRAALDAPTSMLAENTTRAVDSKGLSKRKRQKWKFWR